MARRECLGAAMTRQAVRGIIPAVSFLGRVLRLLRGKTEPPLISVVLLFSERVQLTDALLHAAISRAWGRDIRKADNEYVVNKPPVCFIKFEDMIFLLNNVGKPYVSEDYRRTQASQEFKEKRKLKAVMEHKAFFTVDLMHPKNPGRKLKQRCYRRMCALAAEFVDDDCMAASFPETGQFRPFDTELKDALKADNPLKAVAGRVDVPVIMIEEDDPKLQAATEQARRRWPEFVKAFRNRQPNQMFSIKAPFRDGEEMEWMWVQVFEIGIDSVGGILANSPVSIHNIREGDNVRLPISSVADWIYGTDKKIVGGGFSLEILKPR